MTRDSLENSFGWLLFDLPILSERPHEACLTSSHGQNTKVNTNYQHPGLSLVGRTLISTLIVRGRSYAGLSILSQLDSDRGARKKG